MEVSSFIQMNLQVKDVEGGRIVSYKLPADENDNTEIKEISKNAFHEWFLLLKRDCNVITHYHMKRLDKLKRKSTEDTSNAPSCSVAGPTHSMPSKSNEDEYDEAILQELDDFIKKFYEMKNKTVDEYPKFDLLSQSPKVEEHNEVEVEGYEEHNEAEDVVGRMHQNQSSQRKMMVDVSWNKEFITKLKSSIKDSTFV